MTRNDPIEPYFELKSILELLQDPLRNHHLDTVVKAFNVTVLDPEFIGNLPWIRIIERGTTFFIEDDLLDDTVPEPEFGDAYNIRFETEIVMGREQKVVYDGVAYNDPWEALKVIAQIVRTTLKEFRELDGPDDVYRIDDIVQANELFISPYKTPDYVGITLTFVATIERLRQYA